MRLYQNCPLGMALSKVSDLKLVFTGDNVIEWQPPSGVRYRFERDCCDAGQEIIPINENCNWYVLAQRDISHAKSRVFELINEDE